MKKQIQNRIMKIWNKLFQKPQKIYVTQLSWGLITGCFNTRQKAEHYLDFSDEAHILELEVI